MLKLTYKYNITVTNLKVFIRCLKTNSEHNHKNFNFFERIKQVELYLELSYLFLQFVLINHANVLKQLFNFFFKL